MELDDAARAFREFVEVIRALRTPGSGCPWDLEQDHRSLRPYLIEEAYEVVETIDRADDDGLREELGDLLLQVVLHAQVADDRGAFAITDVIAAITRKMIRRHPHVFGAEKVGSADEVRRNWEEIKAAENRTKGQDPTPAAGLDRLPAGLPALQRAQRLGEKAARARLDERHLGESVAAVREEFDQLQAQIAGAGGGKAAPEVRQGLEAMLGDFLFDLCQVARLLGLSAEDCLRASSGRYVERCREAEQEAPGPPEEPGG